jgi:hypothetical protein
VVGESPPEDWFKVLVFVRRGEGVWVAEFEERWPEEAEVVEKFRHRREVVGDTSVMATFLYGRCLMRPPSAACGCPLPR